MIKVCEYCKKEFETDKNKRKYCCSEHYHLAIKGKPNFKKRKYDFIKTPLHDTEIYKRWQDIKTRCGNPQKECYKNYAGRGIKVCQEWLDDFMNFYTWAINNGYKEGLSIDRIDVNGNYEPSNYRWIELGKQARNRRTTHWLNYKGKKISLAEVAELENVNQLSLFQALKRYKSLEKALEVAKLNKQGLMSTNTTGYVGVYPDGKKWYAKYKHKYLGVFNSIEEAINKRKQAEQEHNNN